MDALARPPRRCGRSAGRAPTPTKFAGSDLAGPGVRLHFHSACESRTTRRLALMLDSLVRVSRRVGRVADATTDPGRDRGDAVRDRQPAATRALRTVRARDKPTGRARPQPPFPREGAASGLVTSIRRRAVHPRAVTPRPKRRPPSRGASGRRRTGRGLAGTLVR